MSVSCYIEMHQTQHPEIRGTEPNQPEGQKEFNNQVIAYLQAKANSDGFKKSSLKYENRSLQGKDGSATPGNNEPHSV